MSSPAQNKYLFGLTPEGSVRDRLSYSGWSLWLRDKEQYRKKYYRNEKLPENPEMLFGKKVAEQLESNDPLLAHVPRYPEPEFEMKVEVAGVPITGYLDSFDPDIPAFLEFKTGHTNYKGDAPWDRVKVAKHEQLPFYSLLIETQFGKVQNKCSLIWLETVFKDKVQLFQGVTFGLSIQELELTGRIETFHRIIYKYERARIRKSIQDVARAITEDFNGYIAQTVRPARSGVPAVGK